MGTTSICVPHFSGFIGSYGKPPHLEDTFYSERARNTDWCGCEVCVSLSEKKYICCHEWNILEEKLEVEDVDSIQPAL